MDDDQSMEEIRFNLDQPRLFPYKNTWTPHPNTVIWCDLKLAHKKGLQFYQTLSHAIFLYNTLPASCIERAVCMKTNEELYYRVSQPTKISSSHAETELAKWTTGSTWSRSKRILRPPKRIGKLWGNLQQQQHQQQNTRHPSFYSPKTGHKSQRNGQTVDSAVRESPEQEIFPAEHEKKPKR